MKEVTTFRDVLRIFGLCLVVAVCSGCGTHYFATALRPVPEEKQGLEMHVQDDGTVSYIYERLEVSVRPMTDEELNRQFSAQSRQDRESTNPYTHGNWRPRGQKWTPTRFTVFRLKVKNYTYPKMLVDPMNVVIVAANGREYRTLSLLELEQYYYPYARGYAGVEYARFEARKDILKQTLYKREDIVFSGQEKEGYIVFSELDHDVRDIAVHLNDIILRFNVMNEPIEMVDVAFQFQRDLYKAKEPRD